MVRVNAFAFDKDSSAMFGYQICSSSREDFNAQMQDFEESIPFSKYYTELTFAGNEVTEEDEEIFQDYVVQF